MTSHVAELFAILVPLIIWVLDKRLQPKAKLTVSSRHQFAYLVDQPLLDKEGNVIKQQQNAYTVSRIVANEGKEAATNIEVVFNWKPNCINIWPVRDYDEKIAPDGRFVMHFRSLAPKEQFSIEVLTINQEPPNLLTARSDQCQAEEGHLILHKQMRPSLARLRTILVLIGLGTVVYLGVLLLRLLVLAA